MVRKAFFAFLYWFRKTPWDTGITPPEVYQFLEKTAPGRALDLGCGTGTNGIVLAEHGWQVTGIDFVPKAIRIARRKARRKGLDHKADFIVGDVTSPDSFQGKYDLILDIGCFHGLSEPAVDIYARHAAEHLDVGGTLLLYVHLRQGQEDSHGASEKNLERLGELLSLSWRQDGDEQSRPSAWLAFVKRAQG